MGDGEAGPAEAERAAARLLAAEPVLELEGLAMGLSGQFGLWRTLVGLGVEEPGFDFEQLAAETAEHRATVEDLHRRAATAIG